MHYILDNEGYVEEVSFGGMIECKNNTCSEYTGKIPTGYSSLENWLMEANIRTYKVVDGNLVYDANRDYKLSILHQQETYDNSPVTRKELGIKTEEENDVYNDLYPLQESASNHIATVEEAEGKVGNFPVQEVNIQLHQFRDIELIEDDFIEVEFIGDNFLPNTATSNTNNGIDYTQNIDKTIIVSGTATEKSTLNLAGTDTNVKKVLTFKGDRVYNKNTEEETRIKTCYSLSGLVEGTSLEFYYYDGTDRTLVGTYNNGIIQFDEDTPVTQVVLTVDKGTSVYATIKPMLNWETTAGNNPILPMTQYKGNLLDYKTVENTSNTTTTLIDNGFKVTGLYAGKVVIDNLKTNTDYYLQYVTEHITGTFKNVTVFPSSSTSTKIQAFTNGIGGTFNTGENTSVQIWFYTELGNTSAETNFTNIQLEEGTVATPYKEYNGRDGQYYVDGVSTQVTRSGKNLIPFINQNFTLKNINYYVNDGSLYLNGISTGETSSISQDFKTNFSFNLKAGTYYISHKIGISAVYLYTSNNESIITLGKNVNKNTFTLENDTTVYIGFYQYQASYDNVNTEIMISSDDETYEPYGKTPSPDCPSGITDLYTAGQYIASCDGKFITFNLTSNLRGLPNGVGDRLWFDSVNNKSIIERKVGTLVLDGSEIWSFSSSTNVFYTDNENFNYQTSNNIPLSNYYQGYSNVSGAGSLKNNQVAFLNGSSPSRIYIKDTRFSNANDFKTWLSTHNTEVQYELATYDTSEVVNIWISINEYEEYKNNKTLIDLKGNKLTSNDIIRLRDNQAIFIKNGAAESELDEEGNEIPVDYEYIYLHEVSMPRTYAPRTHAYCHQLVDIQFNYRDVRNIEVSKISFGGQLTLPSVETDNLVVSGTEINEETIREMIDNSTCYREGDMFVRKKDIVLGGYISTSKTTLYATLFLPKRLDKIKKYTINKFNFTIRGITGYLQEPVELEDFDGILTTYIASENAITFLIKKNSAFDITNNTTAALEINALEITFSELGDVATDDTDGGETTENPIVEVNKSSTITGSTSSSLWAFKTVVKETKINKTDKTSTLTVTNYIGRKSTAGSSYFMGTLTNKYECGGQTYSETVYKSSGTISAGSWYKLGSRTFTVTHTQEPMTINVKGSMSTDAFNPSSASASGTVTLTEI